MKIKIFFVIFLLSFSNAFASEIFGNISTGGSNSTSSITTSGSNTNGGVQTGGSNATTTNTNISGTVLTAPVSSLKSGTYAATQTAVLSAPVFDTIVYTIDGTSPSCTNGSSYQNALSINSTTTLKTAVCYSGKSSGVSTYQYNWKVLKTNQIVPTNGIATVSSSTTRRSSASRSAPAR